MNFNFIKIFVLLIIGMICTFSAFSQNPISEAEIKAQLGSKGVSEQEVNSFLDLKGLDSDAIEKMNPESLVKLNTEFEHFLANRNSHTKNSLTKGQGVKIQEKIDTIIQEIVEEVEKGNEIPLDQNVVIRKYGDQIFKNNNLKLFGNTGNRLIPGNYILNEGDQIGVSIYGSSRLEEVYTITEKGEIVYFNGNRRLILAGLSVNDATKKIARVFRNYYVFNQGEINVTVLGARTISINLYGEVVKPGGYLISAVNSPINALVAAGGIVKTGSYRNIKVIKDNGKTYTVDLYDFLIDPSKTSSFGLSNNDIIHVPLVAKEIVLKGAVKRPMIYELKKDENIESLVQYAGGLKVNADKSNIQIKRYENGELKLIDLPINSSEYKNHILLDGDVVIVKSISSEISNMISVFGEVNNGGDFQLTKGMKVSDLLEKVVFNNSSRLDLALITRNVDGNTSLIQVNLEEILADSKLTSNVEMLKNDKLLVWKKSRFIDSNSALYVTGAVRHSKEYPFDNENMTLSDAILYAGGLRRDAVDVGVIYRRDPLTPNKIEYIRIKPISAVNGTLVEDVSLMPYDSIVVLQNDIIISESYVHIEGDVKNVGKYQYGTGMTLKDLIVLSEGFKISAQTNKVEVNRLVIENNKSTEITVATVDVNPDLSMDDSQASTYELQPFDKVFVRSVPEFEYQLIVSISGEVKYPGKYVLNSKSEKLMSLISRAGGLTMDAFEEGVSLHRTYEEVGAIIMNMGEAKKSKRSKYNYILKHGDEIVIPKRQNIVRIQSNSLNKRIVLKGSDRASNSISIAFFPGKSADYYINEFGGGFGETSDRKSVFVQHANGEIARTKDYGVFIKYPKVRTGSLIVIPELPVVDESKKEEDKVDWTALLNDSVTQAMSILTLLLLVERI